MLIEGVKYIFSCGSAVHRFQATQLFMHLTVTAIPSYDRLSFVSMLSSRATLKTFTVFNAIVCCLFTSLAMSVMRLSIVRVEIILEIMVLLLGKSSIDVGTIEKCPLYKYSVTKWFSMLSRHSAAS